MVQEVSEVVETKKANTKNTAEACASRNASLLEAAADFVVNCSHT